MRIAMVIGGLLLATSAPTLAQAPAASEAKPAPQAPKPARLADGRPNWTGMWVPVGGLIDGSKAAYADGNQPPKEGGVLKSPYKEQHQKLLDEAAAGKPPADPTAACLPPGMPRMMNMPYTMEILQTPGQVTIFGEWQATVRRIFLDRPLPPEDDIIPTYNGTSVAHWEGDTLVVKTVGLRADTPLDVSGRPHSDAMTLEERWQMTDPLTLTDEITVTDPKAFEAPWKMVRRFHHRPDLSIQEYVCEENNRDGGAPAPAG